MSAVSMPTRRTMTCGLSQGLFRYATGDAETMKFRVKWLGFNNKRAGKGHS